MRSILNGMIIAMITMFFATWFLSSTILKNIQASKSSSSSYVNNESISKKIRYGQDSMAESTSTPSIKSYARSPRRTYSGSGAVRFKKTSNPFGPKLKLKYNRNPFAPKLSLRRPAWHQGDRRESELNQQQQQYQQTQKQQTQKQQSTTPSKSISSSPIIGGYQNYVNLLNEQMKD